MDNLVQLDGVTNLRDVGKTVNQFLGRKVVREGVFFRSARLDNASLQDKIMIRDEIGIKTVIDLRTKTELAQQAKRHAKEAAALSLKSRSEIAEPLKIEGLTYHEIKITGGRFERFILTLLPWWSFLKLLFLYLFGYRLAAIKIITQQVMIPRGLLRLGNDTLDRSGPEIREVLELYARPEALPSLVHCTHGKDRTGAAIEHDYHLTDLSVQQDVQARLKEVRQVGLADDWVYTAPGQIAYAESHIQEQYGGLESYLEYIGLGKAEQEKIRQALLY
ncbi:hypothetical protein NLU13_1702 [Sarocladium strictum]|uniref:Tyrosine specific protein phosphatases domain-containing protein n=1 Tax=Sarocladium strictum TaxID=5046 RepID=A0AA39GS84_SARSR|nr:hypothetical protein NLU13_1702 [Sarocladium strictum]